MTPSGTTRLDAALQAQLTLLGERMENGFNELREKLDAYESRIRSVENSQAGCQPLVNARLDVQSHQIAAHTLQIENLVKSQTELERLVVQLQSANRILSWIGGLLGSAVVLWIVTQLLGLIK